MLDINTFSFKKNEDNCLTFLLKEKNILARVYVLEQNLFRVLFTQGETPTVKRTWCISPKGTTMPFEGRNRLDTSCFSKPNFSHHQGNDYFTVETESLKCNIQLSGFIIEWFTKQNNEWKHIANDRKTQAYNLGFWETKGPYHAISKGKDNQFFGLGEKSGEVNKDKKRYRMLNIDPMGYDSETSDPLYKHIPFYINYSPESNTAFGLFYDNLCDSVFDFGQEIDNYHGPYTYYEADAGDLDYYFILGPNIADVTENYAKITGQTAFMPYWALEYSGSTMTYTDHPNAQEELNKFIADCQKNDIPCGSFQLSSGYTSIANKRYVFNWNHEKFPNINQFSQYYRDNGIELCANIKPCLLLDHPKFNEVKAFNGYIQNAKYHTAEVAQFWDALGVYLDFTNPKTIAWWQSNVTEQLLEKGILSTWNDNNEYEVYNDKALCHGFGEPIEIKYIKPVQPLLMTMASFEAQKTFSPNKRPYLITRSGCPGLQRYAQTWSGDNRTEWKTLRYNLSLAKGLSLSGIFNFGHDIGGFAGDAPEPELFLRWVQHGIFYPRFTIHSWNDDGTVNTPWMYPEVLEEIKQAFALRHKLMPYFYQLTYESHINYTPFLKPTFYDFQQDKTTLEKNDDFLVGNILVANIVEKNQTIRPVYLPSDCHWYDLYSNEIHNGKQAVSVNVDKNSMPAFVKEGSIIPVNLSEMGFNKKQIDLGINIYPLVGKGDFAYSIFVDDGESTDYLKGKFANINVQVTCSKENINININIENKGGFKLHQQNLTLNITERNNRIIFVNAKQFDQNKIILLTQHL